MTEYVGLDVSKGETSFCIVDEKANKLFEGKCPTDPRSIFEVLKAESLCPELIVLETGTLSKWLLRGLRDLGLPAEAIDARHAHGVMGLQLNKSDASDAALLAKSAQTGFYNPVVARQVPAADWRIGRDAASGRSARQDPTLCNDCRFCSRSCARCRMTGIHRSSPGVSENLCKRRTPACTQKEV